MKFQNYQLPPLKSLLVLESVVRTGSVTAAAKELSVTHSAVSKQLALLEDWMEISLFDANRRKMVPAENVAHLAKVIAGAFEDINDALNDVLNPPVAKPSIKILAPATLAMRWLIPKLPSFNLQDEPADIKVYPLHTGDEWENFDFDISIRRGMTQTPDGMVASYLFRESLTLVAHESFREKIGETQQETLSRFNLIDVTTRQGELKSWLRFVGAKPGLYKQAMNIAHFYIALDAMLAGQGALVVPTFLVEELLDKGAFIEVLPSCRIKGATYHLIANPSSKQPELVSKFTNWLTGILPS